jgi:rhodanese-related sulfurtransferase
VGDLAVKGLESARVTAPLRANSARLGKGDSPSMACRIGGTLSHRSPTEISTNAESPEPPVFTMPDPHEGATPRAPSEVPHVAIPDLEVALARAFSNLLVNFGVTTNAGAVASVADMLSSGSGPAFTEPPHRIYQAILGDNDVATDEVSTNELRVAIDRGTSVVIDARTPLEYSIGHIPRAINPAPKGRVPMSQYVSDVAEVEKLVGDKHSYIILYCNGPFCGKSRRLAEDMKTAGFTSVKRYQLGASVWRALVGLMEIEPSGIQYIRQHDRTAIFIDAPEPNKRLALSPGHVTFQSVRSSRRRTTVDFLWMTSTPASSSGVGMGHKLKELRRDWSTKDSAT